MAMPWNKTPWAKILEPKFELRDMGDGGDCMFFSIAAAVESEASVLRNFLADTITDADAASFQQMLRGEGGDPLILDGLNVQLPSVSWSVEEKRSLQEYLQSQSGRKLPPHELQEEIIIFFAKQILYNTDDISCVISTMMSRDTCTIDIFYDDKPKQIKITYEGTFWALSRLSELFTSYRIIPIDYNTNNVIVLPVYEDNGTSIHPDRNVIIWYSGNHYQLVVPKYLDTLWAPDEYLPAELKKKFDIK